MKKKMDDALVWDTLAEKEELVDTSTAELSGHELNTGHQYQK